MYKGYKVTEEVIKDYENPLVDLVVQAPCGCQACEEHVQPGHPYCNPSPPELVGDDNITPLLDNNRWYWGYYGPPELVDEWLKGETTDDLIVG